MINEQQQLVETGKHVLDGASGLAVVSTLMGWLPAATALLSLVWVSMRIYETYYNILTARAQKRLRDANE